MSYQTIKPKIIEILNTIADIAVVYNHDAKAFSKYPCATVSYSGHQNDFHDLAANRRTYNFTIRVYYETTDAAKAEEMVGKIADLIIAAIEADVTLGGTCDWAIPTEGKMLYATDRDPALRLIEITVSARKRMAR